tara:strand:- start:17190 stop:17636 length:447 start_codon:yes stop_codon:yes gene_type:complete
LENNEEIGIFENDIKKHFRFLTVNYGFIKIPEYQYVREVHNDYVKQGLIIKISYDGGFRIDILKPKFEMKDILDGKKWTTDYDITSFKEYDLKNLDVNKKIWNSVGSDNAPDKSLWYFAKLLKDNPEILTGNIKKLKWPYLILKKLGL